MSDLSIDYSKIEVKENIPLTNDDIMIFEKKQKKGRRTKPLIIIISSLLILCITYYALEEKSTRFKGDILIAGFVLCGIGYLRYLLLRSLDKANLQKDIKKGKTKLISILINKYTTRYGFYFTFAGKNKDEKINMNVNYQEYNAYQIGQKLIVTYLPHSKEPIYIVHAE